MKNVHFNITTMIARSIISTLSNEMEISHNGLLKKMKFHNFSEEIIIRLFSDLLIAAGDTVSFISNDFGTNLFKDLKVKQTKNGSSSYFLEYSTGSSSECA